MPLHEEKKRVRLKRKKRRKHLVREKEVRRAAKTKVAKVEKKAKIKEAKLDLRIRKLSDKKLPSEAVAKRLSISTKRAKSAIK